MHKKFRVTNRVCALFMLCCFIFGGCSSSSKANTLVALNLSGATNAPSKKASSTLSTQVLTPEQVSPTAKLSPFDLVEHQFDAFVEWRQACNYKPGNCNIGTFTIIGTDFSQEFAAMMREFSNNNIYARPGDGERKITVQSIERDVTSMSVVVRGCVYDTIVLYMGGGIFDDKVASSISSWTMQWHEGKWFWTNYQIYKKVYFKNLCET